MIDAAYGPHFHKKGVGRSPGARHCQMTLAEREGIEILNKQSLLIINYFYFQYRE